MVCIFAFGTAIAQSGLLYRLSLYILRIFPKSYVGQLLGLAVSGIIFTPLIPSSTAKVSLSSSIAQSISEAMGFENKSKGSAGLGLCAMIFYGYISSFFLTGSYINIMAWSLVSHTKAVSWLQWFYYSIMPLILFSIGMFASILFLFKPAKTSKKISVEVLSEQLKTLGTLKGNELLTAVVALGVIIMLMTQSYHNIDSAWIMLIGMSILIISGILDNNSIKNGIDWPFLLFMGVSLSFVKVLSQFGIVAVMTKFLRISMHPFMTSPYTFLPIVVIFGFLITLFVRDEPAVIILVISMLSLTAEIGIHPWVLIMAVILSTDSFFFPYQSATYLTAYYSSHGNSFDNKQGQKLAILFGIVTLLSVFLSIPYWKFIGLIK
jgi:di/tricarboxylate transporter